MGPFDTMQSNGRAKRLVARSGRANSLNGLRLAPAPSSPSRATYSVEAVEA
jgi:hypothetical protein